MITPDGDPRVVAIPLLRLDPDLPVPGYAHPGDAGADLHARVDVTLAPGERALVPTGIALALPPGYAGFTHPRSGLAYRHGLTVLNAPGTIDSGYRGEIFINLVNLDPAHTVTVRRGDRIAQLVVQQVATVRWLPVDSLPGSVRGDTGHGASGGFADHPPAAGDGSAPLAEPTPPTSR